MDFPIIVSRIEWGGAADPITPDRVFGAIAGAWVSVRPVGDKNTYLGVMLGDYAPPAVTFDPATGVLKIDKSFGNPAMWVPDLARVVMGWSSWWGEIKTEADLRKITDADIENVWYVRALKALQSAQSTDGECV